MVTLFLFLGTCTFVISSLLGSSVASGLLQSQVLEVPFPPKRNLRSAVAVPQHAKAAPSNSAPKALADRKGTKTQQKNENYMETSDKNISWADGHKEAKPRVVHLSSSSHGGRTTLQKSFDDEPKKKLRRVEPLSYKKQYSPSKYHVPTALASEKDNECVAMRPWQDEIRPTCNGFHETRMTDEGVAIMGEGGLIRTGWSVAQSTRDDAAASSSSAALTTLRWDVMDEAAANPQRMYKRNNLEAVILGRLSGVECVLNIYASCGTSTVTELADMDGGDFYERIWDLTPLEKLSYGEHIASCLAEIHGVDEEGNATIVHNDLHPGNILFVNGQPKIADFNKARLLKWNTTSQENCKYVSGQAEIDPWVMPEKALGIPSDDESRDIYFLGGILYTILHGRVPLENDSPETRLWKKINGTLPEFLLEYSNSTDLAIVAIMQAIRGSIVPDPKERPRSRQIGTRLQMVLAAALRHQKARANDDHKQDVCQVIHADPLLLEGNLTEEHDMLDSDGDGVDGADEKLPLLMTPAQKMVLAVYLFPLAFLIFYTMARTLNILRAAFSTRFFTDNPAERAGLIHPGKEPVVTVQISTYNEGHVVADTIRACCNLRWPADRLFVDVLDDSTDPMSVAIIEDAVGYWSKRSVNIVHRRRSDRVGYKAGCLRHHFGAIRGDFCALFDADHQPEPDFLLRTMPFFFDGKGEQVNRIGLVQTPWGYYNTHENILTETDTLGLDVHFCIEQTGRGGALDVFGFNGTGGVWRKDAIAAGGGWSWDTVTEDLALSYLTFMKGYDFVFVRDTPQLMESPSCILAHVQQKHRWTKGYLQVFRVSFLEIFRSSATGLFVKLEAFTHMSGPCQYACILLMTVFYPLLVYHEIDSDLILIASTLPHLVPLFEAALAIYVKAAGSDGEYKSFLSRTFRLIYVLPLMALKNGMMIFETRAILDGLFSNDATFLATPKEGATKKKSANGVYHSWIDGFVGWSGILLGLYRLCLFYYVEMRLIRSNWSHIWFGMLSLSVSVGLMAVHGSFLRAKHRIVAEKWFSYALCQNRGYRHGRKKIKDDDDYDDPPKPRPSTNKSSKKNYRFPLSRLIVLMTMLVAYLVLIVFAIAEEWQFLSDYLVISPRPIEWACPVDDASLVSSLSPLVVFAEPRSGSSLLFDMMHQMIPAAPDAGLDLVSLNELFKSSRTEEKIASTMPVLENTCSMRSNTVVEDADYVSHDRRLLKSLGPKAYLESIEQNLPRKLGWPQELIAAFQARLKEPTALLRLLRSVPSKSKHAFFAFKVFNGHLKEASMTPQTMVNALVRGRRGRKQSRFVILWRRRMIASFVSDKIAESNKIWSHGSTSANDAIVVDKDDLEHYINSKRQYYLDVRDTLLQAGVDFEVFEYDRDLRHATQQVGTLKRLWAFMLGTGAVHSPLRPNAVLDRVSTEKQAVVPLDEQVKNWDDVIQWGYGGETKEWEDLLQEEIPSCWNQVV